MKKTSVIWLMAVLLGFGSAAMADNEWGVFGSYWAPSDGDDGVGGGVKIGVEMVDRVQLDLRYSVVNNVINDNGASLDVEPLEFGLSFSVPTGGGIEPYFGVGLGYYFMDGDVAGFDTNVDDEWGFYTSAGIEWILSRSGALYGETTTKLFVEAMYRIVDANDMKLSGGRLEDAELNGLGLQAGLLIGW